MSEHLVIVDGIRTPFCKMGSELAGMSAGDLGAAAVKHLVGQSGLNPETLDQMVFGCVGQPVDSANLARIIALRAGLPESLPAVTVHRNCASGCEAITQAAMAIAAGEGRSFLVGGTESMSNYPFLFHPRTAEKFMALSKARTMMKRLAAMAAFRPRDFKPLISLQLGLSDPVCGLNMGETAELIAREAGLSREDQDDFARESHARALAAREFFQGEIFTVFPPSGHAVEEDNGIRSPDQLQKLGKLKPVFERGTGTVTAGNAPQITDGAVALWVMSDREAEKQGLQPLARLRGYAYAGCDPSRMGLGPLYALAALEAKSEFRLADMDLIEINEAFAGQVLACCVRAESEEFARAELGRDSALGPIDRNKLNVHGGSIALGHPVGATGSRLALTLSRALRDRKLKQGVVTLCVGGGQGAALWLEAMGS
jgi:acetyl-CoA C-acetyltransferase/acetyl-CoA acyltransferase